MTYTVLRGQFVIRYPDRPRQGPEPDGDTVKFRPDTPGLVEGLPRPSGTPPDLTARGISVRLEGIDALETHFAGTHQELTGANAARDELLRLLGFTGVRFFDDLPNKVQSADRDTVRGHVLSNGVDANGRMIGFVHPGEAAEPDGGEVFVDEALMDRSLNALLVGAGLAYPAFYTTLPASLRTRLAGLSRQARADGAGIWPRSTADPYGPAVIADAAALRSLVLWPKLFRRIVPYLATGATGFDGFDAWLRADPVNRDDAILLPARRENGRLHDVIEARDATVRLTEWPEDFVITPDPPPGATTAGRQDFPSTTTQNRFPSGSRARRDRPRPAAPTARAGPRGGSAGRPRPPARPRRRRTDRCGSGRRCPARRPRPRRSPAPESSRPASRSPVPRTRSPPRVPGRGRADSRI